MLLVALAGLCWCAAGCGSAAMAPAGPGEFADVEATIAAALRAIDATERARATAVAVAAGPTAGASSPEPDPTRTELPWSGPAVSAPPTPPTFAGGGSAPAATFTPAPTGAPAGGASPAAAPTPALAPGATATPVPSAAATATPSATSGPTATPAPTPPAPPDRVEGTPRVALEVSEMTGGDAGGTITLTMAFRDLPRAVEAHYTFRVDALGAAECAGAGMGVTRDIETVDENPERRRAAVAPDCPPGDYFILATLTAADGVELASDIVRLAVPP